VKAILRDNNSSDEVREDVAERSSRTITGSLSVAFVKRNNLGMRNATRDDISCVTVGYE